MSDTREANPTAMDTAESGSSQFHLQKERQSAYHDEHGAVASLPQREAHIHTVSQVPLPPYQKLANPGPLGLLAFALTTFVLGLYECGAGLPHSNPQAGVGPNQAAFGLAIFFGGGAQFVAGIFEFRVGNTFGCTVHCSYSAFWLSYAMFLIPSLDIKGQYNGDERAYTFALGIYLILWCFLTVLFLLAALRTNLSIILVFFFLIIAYLLLSIANFIATSHPEQSVKVNKAGGAFTVICAFVAFYAGSSGLMVPETTWVRFPLGEIP
ncbi:GPR1/FUN34/yaaH family protein [Aspergillus bombycis]|uniref:GPR1/FUN34/yaaH family protein n=1 Tax=Aspergillus bombycis TaxID=109264 RepID=A0A1F8A839_9EURO|nr:GPR1/FUN34/yaaH family protein [Aspergillus bombycis]OGM47458.1 GPR1/FUN34/yaaH family protein [Aspergillus bombycis]